MPTFNIKYLEKQIVKNELTTLNLVKYLMIASLTGTFFMVLNPFYFFYLNDLNKAIFILESFVYLFGIYFIYAINKEVKNFFAAYFSIFFIINLYAMIINFFIYKIYDYIFLKEYYYSLVGYKIASLLGWIITFWPLITAILIFFLIYKSFEEIKKQLK